MNNYRPNFQDISLDSTKDFLNKDAWKEKVAAEIHTSIDNLLFETNEQIKLKALYTKEDLDNCDHLEDKPGLPPYTRGPYPTMYANRPWTVRQYAGFSTAEESNAFYRRNLAMGQKGLFVD